MAKKSLGGTPRPRTRAKTPQAQPAASKTPTSVDDPAADEVQPPLMGTVGRSRANGTEVVLRTGFQAFELHDKPLSGPPGLVAQAALSETRSEIKMGLAQAAMQWTYIVRNRGRWSISPELKEQQAVDAECLLKSLGVDDAALKELARARIIEVAIPWTEDEARNWPARILPWESVIGGATHGRRNDKPITIIRHLDRSIEAGAGQLPERPMKKRVLFVVSEPGPLKGRYQFDTERSLLRDNLADACEDENWEELRSPTKKELVDKLNEWQPDVVHFAGLDTHQVLSILSQTEKETGRSFDYWDSDHNPTTTPKDGYVLKGADKMLAALDAEELAQILENNGYPPRLVVWNFYNSAARIASRVVSRGVETSIGFQDSFDDSLAEQFLAVLYSRLDWSNWNTAIAFQAGWEHVRNQPQQHQGTGVVHWSAKAFLKDQPRGNGRQISVRPPALLEPEQVAPEQVGRLVTVVVKVRRSQLFDVAQQQTDIQIIQAGAGVEVAHSSRWERG
jgi:hypothetical protein